MVRSEIKTLLRLLVYIVIVLYARPGNHRFNAMPMQWCIAIASKPITNARHCQSNGNDCVAVGYNATARQCK